MEKNYDLFAKDYHNKRRYHWKELEAFLEEINNKENRYNGYNLDLGCANGRNFNLFLNPNSRLVGIDNSIELLGFALERLKKQGNNSELNSKSINLILSDIRTLPLRDDAIANIFSIATIHHIKENVHRKEVIEQLYRILKNGGFFLLTVWRRYQKKYRYYFIKVKIRRLLILKYKKSQEISGLIEFGDTYVPWTLSNREFIYNRFYHFFSRREIKNLVKNFKIKLITKRGGPNKKDNFFILAQKVIEKGD